MQAHQYIFMGTGAAIAGFGLWGHLTLPRLYAAHAADVASRVPIVGRVVEYELDSEDHKYTRIIEYEVNGHCYRISGWNTVHEKGEPLASVRLAYKREKRSDAIEVEREFSGNRLSAKISLVTGVVFVLMGAIG